MCIRRVCKVSQVQVHSLLQTHLWLLVHKEKLREQEGSTLVSVYL